MQRREFIKALPIIAVSTQVVPKATAKTTHLIVLGSIATSIIEKHGFDINVDSLIFITKEEPKSLALPYKFIAYHPPESAFQMIREHKILKDEPLPEINLSETVISILQELEGNIIVFAALGNFTGTTHYQAIARYFSEKNMPAHFICSWPFEFEGSKRRRNAIRSSEYVSEKYPQQIFALDHIRYLYGNLSVRSAFEKADEWLAGKVKSRLG